MTKLQAPFPYCGGKSSVSNEIWKRLGDVPNYIEPFAGSLAVLLGRPHEPRIETVNDIDGLICNFWRAPQADPNAVAHWADWPVVENDLHARHIWLVNLKDSMQARLEGDPEWFDAKAAGWWVWGISCWIGAEWCKGNGPWQSVDGQLVHLGAERGVKRQLVYLNGAGRGVQRKRVDLGSTGQGVHRKLVHLRTAGQGVKRQCKTSNLVNWMNQLAERLRRVRVCCGDWSRVCGPTPTFKCGLTGIFLDPPYGVDRDAVYNCESFNVAAKVREWAIENEKNPLMRIALCGYEGEHAMPAGWKCHAWKAHGGYSHLKKGGASENRTLERIWFSSHCLDHGDFFEQQEEDKECAASII